MDGFPKEVWLTLLEWLKVPDMLSFSYTCKPFYKLIFASFRKLTVGDFDSDLLFNRVNKEKIVELYYRENYDQKAFSKNGINYSPEFLHEKSSRDGNVDNFQSQYNKIQFLTSLQVLHFHKKSHCVNEQNLWKIETNFLSTLTRLNTLSIKNVHSVETDIKYFSRFTNLHTLSLENFYHHLPERPLVPVFDAKALGGIKSKYTNPDFKAKDFFDQGKPQAFSFNPPISTQSPGETLAMGVFEAANGKAGMLREEKTPEDESKNEINDTTNNNKPAVDLSDLVREFVEATKGALTPHAIEVARRIAKDTPTKVISRKTAVEAESEVMMKGFGTAVILSAEMENALRERATSESVYEDLRVQFEIDVITALNRVVETSMAKAFEDKGVLIVKMEQDPQEKKESPKKTPSRAQAKPKNTAFDRKVAAMEAAMEVREKENMLGQYAPKAQTQFAAELDADAALTQALKASLEQKIAKAEKSQNAINDSKATYEAFGAAIGEMKLGVLNGPLFPMPESTATTTTEEETKPPTEQQPPLFDVLKPQEANPFSNLAFDLSPASRKNAKADRKKRPDAKESSSGGGLRLSKEDSLFSGQLSQSLPPNNTNTVSSKKMSNSANVSSSSPNGFDSERASNNSTSTTNDAANLFSLPSLSGSSSAIGIAESAATGGPSTLTTSGSLFSFPGLDDATSNAATTPTTNIFSLSTASSDSESIAVADTASGGNSSSSFAFPTFAEANVFTFGAPSFNDFPSAATSPAKQQPVVDVIAFPSFGGSAFGGQFPASQQPPAQQAAPLIDLGLGDVVTVPKKNENNNNNFGGVFTFGTTANVNDVAPVFGLAPVQQPRPLDFANQFVQNYIQNINAQNAGHPPAPRAGGRNYIEHKADFDKPPKPSPQAVLGVILRSLSNLTLLNLTRVNFKVDSDVIDALSTCKRLKKLQILQKDGFSVRQHPDPHTQPTALSLAPLQCLAELDVLSVTSDVTDVDYLTSLKSLNLRYLAIKNKTQYLEAFVQAGRLHTLEELSYEYFPPDSLCEVTARYYLPKLRLFSLLDINKMLNAFFVRFEPNDFFLSLKNLRLQWGILGFGSDLMAKVSNIEHHIPSFTSLQNLIVDSYFRRKVATSLGQVKVTFSN